MKKIAILLTKVTVTIALLAFVLHGVSFSTLLDTLSRLRFDLVMLVVVLLGVQFVIAGMRWKLISNRLCPPYGNPPFLRMFFIGQFFNQALPSTIGGDGLRIWLHSRFGVPFGVATQGVLLDRISGLVTLLLISTAFVPWQVLVIKDPSARLHLNLLLTVGLGGLVLVLVFSMRMFRNLLSTVPLLQTCYDFAQKLRLLLLTPKYFTVGIGLSVLGHTLTMLVFWVLAQSLGLMEVAFLDIAMLIPPIMIISVVPVSIAGWGVREAVTVTAFGFIGISAEKSVLLSLCFGLCLVIASLPGACFWLLRNKLSEKNCVDETYSEDQYPVHSGE